MPDSSIENFKIDIPESELEDLRTRLRNARWPEPLDDPEWNYGIEHGALRDLAGYWLEQFDWRKQEAALNGFAQFRTTIDGQGIHFIHVRSPHEDAIPLIISHGWPGSVVEFMKIIGPLTDPVAHGGDAVDAFHVVCPSLPGYGFSQPNNAKQWCPSRIAQAWAELMQRLDYARYGVQGGDWGSMVSAEVARQDPEHCFAAHVNFLFAPPPSAEALENLCPEDQAMWDGFQNYTSEESGYAQLQSTKPQTLGYALADSPLGQLAWIAEKFRAWTDCDGVIENAVSRDQLLTNVSLYWFTNTGGSSGRLYREARLSDTFIQPRPVEAPIGVAAYPAEVVRSPRAWLESFYNLVHYTEMPRGGHFAAMEQPESLVEDIRSFYSHWR